MAFHIRGVQYFYATVTDQPGEAYRLLSQFAELGVNMLAFTGVPVGPMRTQLTIFPEDPPKLDSAAKQSGLTLDGPHHALLVQGDDALGALTGIHERLYEANVNVYASTGVTDGRGGYGYILYVRPDKYAEAMAALDM
jgi:hypothetical protein